MSTGHDTPKNPAPPAGDAQRRRTTIRTLQAMADEGRRFACLACYDFTTARWLDRAGVHVLLAGDSAANVVLGHETTHPMPFELAVWLTAAVRRGAEHAHVMADMPFMSYQADDAEALRNAGRLLSEGRADSVKLEVDASFAPLVKKMTRAGIPVCAHVGTKPQLWALSGGPKISGRRADEADLIVEDAVALERAGAVMLLIEATPPGVADRVMAATSVPLIGIGAGPACHGQILVVNDLVGMSDLVPRFVEPVADLGPRLEEAGREWVRRVAEGRIGGRTYTAVESDQTPEHGSSDVGAQDSKKSVRVSVAEL
ncbi:MAG: 3-methyl-2-oxobutanoate hydroxymethyltransferase [Phycisphaerales bacterium]|nr:3-methyl-2-oxobutanoate hydroxymethyltransferase [Phycisphaerales bacterium]